MMRVGVLASGGGSNFQALVEQLNVPNSPANVVLLVCNVSTVKRPSPNERVEGGAPVQPMGSTDPRADPRFPRAVDRAKALQVPTEVIDQSAFAQREAFDEAMVATLQKHRVELVCLAGYMRLVTSTFLRHFAGRVLNVHPALLPSFPGLHGARQALEHGVKVTGCTVHFVDEGTDTGPIIAQAAVPVLPGDTEATLSTRIQSEEHRLFALVVRAVAQGRVRLEGRHVAMTEAIT